MSPTPWKSMVILPFLWLTPTQGAELADALRVDQYFHEDFSAANEHWIPGNWSFAESDTQFDPGQVRFAEGRMDLGLEAQPTAGKAYVGGHYQTRRADFGYGVYEVVMRRAQGPGVISSFFAFWDGDLGQGWNEIDMEFLRGNREVQFNYIPRAGHTQAHDTPVTLDFDPTTTFETYRFEYTADYLRFYLDQRQLAEIRDEKLSQIEAMPDGQGMKIMMNVWIPVASLREWAGDPSTANPPVTASYDQIRYFPTFGEVAVGGSANQTLRVTNTSDQTIDLTATVDGDFALMAQDCEHLAPAASCQAELVFSPGAEGLRTGSLRLADATLGTLTIPLWGHGQSANSSPADVTFTYSREVTSRWETGYCQNLTVTNTGAAAGDWEIAFATEGQLGDAWEGVFRQQGHTITVRGLDWNQTLSPGASVTVGHCILGEAEPPSACAVFDPTSSPELTIPCAVVGEQAYRGELRLLPTNVPRFQLDPASLGPASVTISTDCARFPHGPNHRLRLPCVRVNSAAWWAELEAADSGFTLVEYGQ